MILPNGSWFNVTMTDLTLPLLQIGTTFGAVAGTVHACAVFLQQRRLGAAAPAFRAYAKAAYFAAWTLVLWVLFGSYVLFLWIIAAVIYAVHLVRRRPGAAGAG